MRVRSASPDIVGWSGDRFLEIPSSCRIFFISLSNTMPRKATKVIVELDIHTVRLRGDFLQKFLRDLWFVANDATRMRLAMPRSKFAVDLILLSFFCCSLFR